MDMLLLRTFVFVVAVFIAAQYEPCFGGCARSEYEINGECCPMCAPGNSVYWHCTVDTSTTCVPCPASTFTDEPNGLPKCFPCTVCDTDTTCEPQEKFYCIKTNKGSCELAVEHSKCKPGQYIKHIGTTFSDTECTDCTDGTYSNGSVMACLPHSQCEMMGLKEKTAGTTTSDAECEKVDLIESYLQFLYQLVSGVSYKSQPTKDDESAQSP